MRDSYFCMAAALVGFYFYPMGVPPPSLPASVTLLWKAQSHGCFSSFARVSEILLQVNTVSLSHLTDIQFAIMCQLCCILIQTVIKSSQVRKTIHTNLLIVIPIRGIVAPDITES